MNYPQHTAIDSAGNLYIADTGNRVVEKVTPQGTLSVIAGTGGYGSPTPGSATSSAFKSPDGVAVDSSGNVYVADGSSSEVVKISPAGTLSIFAGTGSPGSPTPGAALSSELNYPAGLAIDQSGDLYIADELAYVVEKVTPSGTLSIAAGSGTYGTPSPGPATSSPMREPSAVAVDATGDIYIADSYGYIYKVTPSGTLSIFAGNGVYGPVTPGPATSSDLGEPSGVAVDSGGNIYIAASANGVICQVTPTGTLSVVAGTGTLGPATAGPPTSSELDYPGDVTLDSAGDLYITDTQNNRIEEITGPVPGSPTNVAASASGTAVTVTWAQPSSGPTPTSYTVTPIVNGVAGTPAVVTGTTYTLTGAISGDTYSFEVAAGNGNGFGLAVTSNAVSLGGVTMSGYWTVAGDGGVFSFGPNFYGSTGNLKLNQPVFAITSTADGKGYWFVARDGGVFSYGDALFHGSVPALGIHVTNIVGMAADTATGGYWLVGSDGGVYAFGAPFDGSIPGLGQHLSNVVGIAATADGGGYYLVSSTGAVYAFGDAKYQGGANSLPRLNAPIVGLSVDSATGGYWEAGSDGGVYAYGAPFEGSAGGAELNAPVVGISAATSGSGYYLVGSDGGVFSYNAPFFGSMGGKHLNAPMVGMAVAG